jgi:hypothetical protein
MRIKAIFLVLALALALLSTGSVHAAEETPPEPDPGNPLPMAPVVIGTPIDLVPDSQENFFNVTAARDLRMVIYGSEDLDVTQINGLSLVLRNAGVTDCPGAHPARVELADVGPILTEHAPGPARSEPIGDGMLDLVVDFSCDAMTAILAEAGHGAEVQFDLHGEIDLACGCVDMMGSDTLTVVMPGEIVPAVYLPLFEAPAG